MIIANAILKEDTEFVVGIINLYPLFEVLSPSKGKASVPRNPSPSTLKGKVAAQQTEEVGSNKYLPQFRIKNLYYS
ncbi:MAG: hypothetical protein NC033_01815 [Clostridiales bacterium]|nr:hypothetical protein [Clostridiales bacterium]